MDKYLTTFSLISTQWEKYNKSYLDNFIPLFATLLIEKEKKSFEQKDYYKIAEDFRELFGLPRIPPYLITSLVSKLIKIGVITKENNIFIVKSQKIIEKKLYIKDEINSCSNSEKRLCASFISFCNKNYSKLFTEKEAADIILNFINDNSSEIFFKENIVHCNNNGNAYFVGKFLANAFTENPEIYKIFVNLSLGKIAFDAMYYAPPESERESLKKCVFYFDSSFIFPLLGIDSLQRESIIKEIITEIRSKGGFVKIYKHTYDEILEVLESAKEYIESPNYDPRLANKALFYMRQEGYSVIQVDLIIKSIDRVLKENFIGIERNTPDKKLGINENMLFQEISSKLTLREYETADKYSTRTERDVNSIIYTYEKRKKLVSSNFVNAKYSFITENTLLTKADKKIIYEHINKEERKDFFPAAILEAMLCSYLYLGSYNKAAENTSMSVLATALTCIRPSQELEALIKDTASKLRDSNRITEKEYHLATTSYLIKDCLAEKTLCSYEKVHEETIFSLIEDAKDLLGSEERKKRKEAEAKLYEEYERNEKRIKKAEKIAKIKSIIVFMIQLLLLAIPYIFSIIPILNISWKLKIGLSIGWTIFCFIINHFRPLNIKKIWKQIYDKQLKKEYEYFEISVDEKKSDSRQA